MTLWSWQLDLPSPIQSVPISIALWVRLSHMSMCASHTGILKQRHKFAFEYITRSYSLLPVKKCRNKTFSHHREFKYTRTWRYYLKSWNEVHAEYHYCNTVQYYKYQYCNVTIPEIQYRIYTILDVPVSCIYNNGIPDLNTIPEAILHPTILVVLVL